MSLKTKVSGLREVWQFDNRLWLTVTKTLFPAERLHVYRFKNLEILVDHDAGDANGAREVLTSPMYRRFLPEIKQAAPLNVLDLGGNNGGFPLLLKSENIALKKVVSVELNPRTVSRLRFNLERNLDCEVIVINAALCGETKTFEIRLGAGSASDNVFGLKNGNDGSLNQYRIAGMTFDELYKKHFADQTIEICKMDVEGAEFEVFKTDFHQHLRNCRFVIMEIHEYEGLNVGEIVTKMQSLGFRHFPPAPGVDEWVHFFVNSKFV